MYINIALGFDKKFCEHAAVTIKSIIENSNIDIVFYLMIDKSVSFTQQFLLKKLIQHTKHKIKFVQMNNAFNDLFTGTWSKAMYYPILLSSICKENRILFLDSDVVVTGDLTEFYKTPLDNYFCAAVQDYGMRGWIKQKHLISISNSKEQISIDKYFSDIRQWGKEDLSKYFNSGMILMNLDEMRKFNAENEMKNILKYDHLACPDQDCFNICFHNKVKILPPEFNFMVVQPDVYKNLEQADKILYDEYLNQNKTPLIIHYLAKPWLQENVFKEELYFKYRNLTPWKFKQTKINRQKFLRLKLSKNEMYLHILGKCIFSTKKEALC